MGKYKAYMKPTPRRHRVRRFFGWVVLIAAFVLAVASFYFRFKLSLSKLIAKTLSLDPVLLCYLLIYIFVIGALLLLMIIYWIGWDNIRFRLKRHLYRSSLVVKDYYARQRKLKVEGIFHQFDSSPGDRLNVSQKELEERSLARDADQVKMVPLGNISYKNGKLDGVFVSYYENGNIESEVTYKNGKLEGPFRAYYIDGQCRAEKFYKDGKLDGIFKAWDEDGSMFFEIHLKGGLQHGPDKTFYRHGVVQYLDMYDEGFLVHRKTFDEMGNLMFSEDFR